MALSPNAASRKDAIMPSGNSMQHRHFAVVASVMKRRFVESAVSHPIWTAREIATIFADELAGTNQNFDRARFMRACGLGE